MAIAVDHDTASRRHRQLGPDRPGGSPSGTAVGVIASIRVQMTAMPQMVALYNGVGGGAMALISWSEFRHALELGAWPRARDADPDPVLDGDRLDLLLGLEHRLRQAPGPDPVPAAQAAGPADPQRAAADRDRRRLRQPRSRPRRSLAGRLHRSPDRGGAARQPGRAADRRRRHAGRDLPAQRLHGACGGSRRIRARQRRADRRRHAGRLLGNDPHARDGDRDEPLGRQHPLRRLRRGPHHRRPAPARSARTLDRRRRTPRSSSPTPTRS